ncbi:hypothetical protein GV827_20290 [Sulfitobacter sp. JBTF-M27]|uniref:Flp family type IVb pilin n=1 Tax=Sulfitobacter sediminilitoris TaxID=2698830 RepID=A0A6P0CHE5_9RHOB|nr:hypothetical protein [Sulfitobacter sediminilitoris]NEK24718.1 hypothetical protein [Sulfitobacter sediminilitoris]
MISNFGLYLATLVHRFRKEEDGLALTEYLILLGLLTGAVIVAVLAFGTQLGVLWQEWATWLENETRLGAPS